MAKTVLPPQATLIRRYPKFHVPAVTTRFWDTGGKPRGGGALCSSANRGINKVLTTRTCRNPRLRRHPRKEGARKSVLASNHALVKYTKGYTDMAVTFIHGCILLLPKVSNAILRFRLSLCAVTQSVPLSTLHQRKEPSDEHALATQSFGGKRTRINQ